MEYYLIGFAKQDECTAAVQVSADIEVVQFGGFTCWYNIQHKKHLQGLKALRSCGLMPNVSA